MKTKLVKSTLLGLLSLQNLVATSAHAITVYDPKKPNNLEYDSKGSPSEMAEVIIQKRLIGFDPKQAVETLTYLRDAGVEQFEKDGAVLVTPEMIPNIMASAAVDDLEVRILHFENEIIRVKFAAHDIKKFDPAKIDRARDLAQSFAQRCDMDGK